MDIRIVTPPLSRRDIELATRVEKLVSNSFNNTFPDLSLEHLLQLKERTKKLGVPFKRYTEGRGDPIPLGDLELVNEFLWLLFKLETITKDIAETCTIHGTLKMIVLWFPQVYKDVASSLIEKFEAQGWGLTVVDNAGAVGTRAATTTILNDGYRVAPDNHPIFGLAGVCHHIMKSVSNTYKIDPLYPKKTAKVFGHNGIAVGTCWPLQVCALRDGAHGQRMAGISGDIDLGTWSIIVGGAYKDIDRDLGDELFYSTADAHAATKDTPDLTNHGTRCLMRSHDFRHDRSKGVRVLRKSDGHWDGCPREGLRYDGLYKVMEFTIKRNLQKGAFLQFKLVRMGGQEPIAKSRPTTSERRDFRRVQDGY